MPAVLNLARVRAIVARALDLAAAPVSVDAVSYRADGPGLVRPWAWQDAAGVLHGGRPDGRALPAHRHLWTGRLRRDPDGGASVCVRRASRVTA